MKTNKPLTLLVSLMALVACTDLPDNPPDEGPTGQNTNEQSDYLVFRQYTKVDGPLPDAPEREMAFNFKDSIFVVNDEAPLGFVSVKNDPEEAVLGFYFAVSGSEADYYYDVPLTDWMSVDSIFSAEIGVYPPEDAGVGFPFSTEIYIVPYGENGPLKKTIGTVVAEESVVTSAATATSLDIAEALKTNDGEVWELSCYITWGYGVEIEESPIIVGLPGQEQLYARFNYNPAPSAELDGCCTPDGFSHIVGAHMGVYGECIRFRRSDGSEYVNPYLTTLEYRNQYIRDYDFLEFPSEGTTFLREIKSHTQNVDPMASNFCDEQASYHYADFQQHSNGDYTFDPVNQRIEFNTMGSIPDSGGWPTPSGKIWKLSPHDLFILIGNEEITRVQYRKGKAPIGGYYVH